MNDLTGDKDILAVLAAQVGERREGFGVAMHSTRTCVEISIRHP
jgi:hypothetical protein